MFGEAGHLYVYFTYGMHFCANVVTGKRDVGEAVLLRAVEPMEGVKAMKRNRGLTYVRDLPGFRQMDGRRLDSLSGQVGGINSGATYLFALTNGPAKLCEAFAIQRPQNGIDLLGGEIYITEGITIRTSDIGTSTRIGITKGKEKKWRYFVKGNDWVSG
jgi:DNA-3-methyladenine glycosylase